MRSFIALELPNTVKQAAHVVIKDLMSCGADVKWVKPELMHITLKFLGDIDEGLVPDIAASLDKACAKFPPFEFTVSGCGAFPPRGKPSVVWLGLEGEIERLAAMAAQIEEAMEPHGFKPENRRFKPHITLGRVRRPRGKKPPLPHGGGDVGLKRAIAAFSGYKGPDFLANHVILMMSVLRSEGPAYSPLHTITLAQ